MVGQFEVARCCCIGCCCTNITPTLIPWIGARLTCGNCGAAGLNLTARMDAYPPGPMPYPFSFLYLQFGTSTTCGGWVGSTTFNCQTPGNPSMVGIFYFHLFCGGGSAVPPNPYTPLDGRLSTTSALFRHDMFLTIPSCGSGVGGTSYINVTPTSDPPTCGLVGVDNLLPFFARNFSILFPSGCDATCLANRGDGTAFQRYRIDFAAEGYPP